MKVCSVHMSMLFTRLCITRPARGSRVELQHDASSTSQAYFTIWSKVYLRDFENAYGDNTIHPCRERDVQHEERVTVPDEPVVLSTRPEEASMTWKTWVVIFVSLFNLVCRFDADLSRSSHRASV